MVMTNNVKGWIGVLMTEDSSSHWPIKRRYVYSETSRRAGLEFVCIFGHDGNGAFMKKPRKTKKMPTVSADEIARRAERGEDISKFFTNEGKMMPPIQRVNVDFSREMLTELDEAARRLNISRQAVIKTLVREGLDRRYMASSVRKGSRLRSTDS